MEVGDGAAGWHDLILATAIGKRKDVGFERARSACDGHPCGDPHHHSPECRISRRGAGDEAPPIDHGGDPASTPQEES